jgi:putative membrane-bound dehydrogenase-like protein
MTLITFFRHLGAVLFLCVFLIGTSGCQKPASPFSSSAGQALATFDLEPGFQIELVAAEPLIADPVAMEIDEFGRLYVVEMHGYPLDKSGSGKVKLLLDTNGDGQFDQSTVFAEGLMLPTGIMRWKKGVLVTDAPHVLYLEDSNGDGKADIIETVLTGFALSNPQHNLNSPLLGLDNWIYLAHEPAVTAHVHKEEFGDRGEEIRFPGRSDSPRLPQNADGRNVRFRPDQNQLEALSGYTQFGQSFDAWGRHLLVSNANHLYQEVIAARYLKRNPDLLVSEATFSLPDHGKAAQVFPITQHPEHQLLTDVGVMTSACGVTAYLGGAFPATFDSVVFVAEPVHNIVHADILSGQGATFKASRLRPQKEFLASTDAWFRPVNMYVGPDGALYVIDYYRQIIEHPEWMAEEVAASGALYNGTDQGRLYRITPVGTKPASWSKNLRLGDASDEQLVEALAHPNIWWCRNAQRLLLDRNNPDIVPSLSRMAQNESSALGRLHALWTLEGMGQLQADLITRSLQDPVAGVRENAIKLAELHLEQSPEIAQSLLSFAQDPDPKVRYQLLCTLGYLDSPEAALARQRLLFADVDDEWVQIAALSAPSNQATALLEAALTHFGETASSHASLFRRLGAMIGASQRPDMVRQLIARASAPAPGQTGEWQAAVLTGLAQGLKGKSGSAQAYTKEQHLLVQTFFDHEAAPVRSASLRVLQELGLPQGPRSGAALQRALKLAKDANHPPGKRADALRFLTLSDPAAHTAVLTALVRPTEPLPVQLAALQAISAIPGQPAGKLILEKWSVLTPEVREAALSALITHKDRVRLLLEALEDGQVNPSSLGWPRTVRLMNYHDDTIRNRARALLAGKEDNRKEVIQQYEPALALTGDLARGKLVYQQACAVCHSFGGKLGVAYGPDLAPLGNRQPANIMADILDPNKSIADGYDLWAIELNDGSHVQGIIATESPTALTLRMAGGQETVIPRQNIATLQTLPVSAMPAGLESQINQQQMADLLAFIRGGTINQ